jgi:hypothetical protein
VYRQREGAAMGSPVSPIVANLFMENFEQRVMTTAPILQKFGIATSMTASVF